MNKVLEKIFSVISIALLGIVACYVLIVSLLADGGNIWQNVGTFLLHVLAVGSLFFLLYDSSGNKKGVNGVVITFSVVIFLFFVFTFWIPNFGNPDPNAYVFFAIQSYPILYILFATVWAKAKTLFYKIVTRLYLFLAIIGYILLFNVNYGMGAEGENFLLAIAFVFLILPGVWVVVRSLKW